MLKKYLTIITILYTSVFSYATDYYVAPNGNDLNNGDINNPVESIKRAQQLASSGDTVYIRGLHHERRPNSAIL